MDEEMIRYAVLTEKNPREIVLLRGMGCEWRRCRFCDYHLDGSSDREKNELLNRSVLKQVTGRFGSLEVINSGSFTNIDPGSMDGIEETCHEHQITTLRFECHWKSRAAIVAAKDYFRARHITLKIKMGVETFDQLFRECYLDKGIDTAEPADIARYADEVCLLSGLPGQTVESMEHDIATGLQFFERICVNLMTPNSSPVQPDPRVIDEFNRNILPRYRDNPRVDILQENTDFGVGVHITGDKDEISK
jgi:hypothetical protein